MLEITSPIQRHTRAPHTTHTPHTAHSFWKKGLANAWVLNRVFPSFCTANHRLCKSMELYLTLFTPGLMHVFDTACCSAACCHAWRIARSLCKGRVEAWPVNRPAVGRWDFWAGSVERIPDVVWAPYESLFAEGVAVFLRTPDCWDSWGLGSCR